MAATISNVLLTQGANLLLGFVGSGNDKRKQELSLSIEQRKNKQAQQNGQLITTAREKEVARQFAAEQELAEKRKAMLPLVYAGAAVVVALILVFAFKRLHRN